MRYRPGFDGIRALAVLAVLAFHVRPDLVPGGWIGVDVFFVLSGWLITSILVREHTVTGTMRIGSFYLRRALRLMPALIAAVIFAAVVVSTAVSARDFVGDAASALTYTFDFRLPGIDRASILSHTWSLGVEEQFYLVWPLLLSWWLRAGRNPAALAGGLFAVSTAVSIAVTAADGVHLVSFTPIGHAPELAAGATVAILAPRVPLVLALVAAVPPVVLAALADDGSRWQYLGVLALVAVGVALTLQHVATSGSVLARWLGWRPLVWLGRRSYGIYLYHFPVLYLVDAQLSHGTRQPAIVLGSIAVAAVSYQFVELPFLRLKHRRFEPPSHRPEPVPT